MIAISAKELRMNLSEYLHRAMAGEVIEVIYRSRPAVYLGDRPPKKEPQYGEPEKGTARAFLENYKKLEPNLKRHKSSLDPNKSWKQLYEESLRNDPKYKRYFSK